MAAAACTSRLIAVPSSLSFAFNWGSADGHGILMGSTVVLGLFFSFAMVSTWLHSSHGGTPKRGWNPQILEPNPRPHPGPVTQP